MENSYFRNYYKEHKERYKQYNKEHYSREYFKLYRKNNEEKIEKIRLKQKKKNNGNYIYMLVNSNSDGNNIIYIGSTTDIMNRMSAHLTGSSNIHLNYKELVKKYDLERILYLDFSEYEISRNELYYLEYYLKQKHKEIIDNNVRIDLDKISDKRKKQLENILSKLNFKTFDDSKYWDM